MEENQRNLAELDNFVNACNEITSGKFILAEIKIRNFLKTLAENASVCEILEDCLQNYNFDKEFAKAKISNGLHGGYSFKLPEGNSKVIALVYCMLCDINSKNIDFYSFINTYFNNGMGPNVNYAYSYFCESVMVPFKNAMIGKFNMLEERDEFEQSGSESLVTADIKINDTPEIDDAEFEQLILIIQQITDQMKYERKIKEQQKEEINIILKGLVRAAQQKDLMLISAIAIGLDYLMKNVKSARFFYQELQEQLSLLF